MTEANKSSVFAVDILAGIGFGLLLAVALVFINHNPFIALIISIIYNLLQIPTYRQLLNEKNYIAILWRAILSGCFACILGAVIWGIFFLSIDFTDKVIFIVIISLSFLLSVIYAILKNFFPESLFYKKISQTVAGHTAIGVLEKE
jgi:hypothetical protein